MAERDLSAGQLAAIAAGTVRPAIFAEAEVVSGGVASFVRVWTGLGDYSWDGKTWMGAGRLLGLTVGEESREMRAVEFQVSLSGQRSDLLSTVLQNVKNNRPVKVWLGLFDAAGALIDTPYLVRRGLTSRPTIADDGPTATIALQVRDRRAALDNPRERRYTGADQANDFPADLGFNAVEALQDAQFVWPPR